MQGCTGLSNRSDRRSDYNDATSRRLTPSIRQDLIFDNDSRSVAFDLKRPEASEAVLRLIERSDALIEGFRPGVMERLGLGPDKCLTRRLSGGAPLAKAAGHDGQSGIFTYNGEKRNRRVGRGSREAMDTENANRPG